VSWEDCAQFITRLNGLGRGVFRLPTEAEWEYACRAGGEGDTYSNANRDNWLALIVYSSVNPFGVCAMLGQGWEWCQDVYGPYQGADQTDPQGPASGPERVSRGGSRRFFFSLCRAFLSGQAACLRSHFRPDHRDSELGLRVVRVEP
jgi:formylglycine-generating enzyme required for sulfatase activity